MLALFSFLLGAIVGSFLNVLVIRHGARSVTGRSVCLSCSSKIAWFDNVPVISWLALRGRCRACGSRISIQYPLVEALSGLLFALVGSALLPALAPFGAFDALIVALHILVLGSALALAVYDARHTILPDQWVVAFGLSALAIALLTNFGPLSITLLSGPAVALPLFVLWLTSRGTWMGLGDAKLAFGIGWLLGPWSGFLAVLFAFVIGALVSVCILLPLPRIVALLRSAGIARWHASTEGFTMKSEVAFGPFLIASFFAVWLADLYQIPLPL